MPVDLKFRKALSKSRHLCDNRGIYRGDFGIKSIDLLCKYFVICIHRSFDPMQPSFLFTVDMLIFY